MGRLADAYPRDPLIQVNHGLVLARAGGPRDLADAVIFARRALALHPGLAPAHACLGVVASKQGRVDEAEAHFTEAIRLSDPSGYRNLGLLACAGGRWEEAEPMLERATLVDPLDARAWAGLGSIELHRGRIDEALPHLRRAGMLDPRDSSIARGLALALEGSGDPAGAEEAIRRALALAPPPGTWILLLELAGLLIHRGEPPGNPVLDEEARQLLAGAGEYRPDDPGIFFYEGVAESRLGNPKRGLELFSSSMRGSGYRIPAQENIRRLRKYLGSRKGLTRGVFTARVALALFSLSQLAATWYLFTARLVSETGFGLLIAMFSGLFALAGLLPARNGGVRTESLPELVLPERTFVPSPEADMVSPLIRLRTALRPRTGLSPRP
jgi:Flp pilus assembly protein TadD